MNAQMIPPPTGRALSTLAAVVALCVAPAALAAPAASASAAAASARPARPAAPAPLVDINTANRRHLQTLPGIGKAEADRIVAGRPYFSKADLATRKVLPTGVYLSIKNRIIAKPAASAPGKAPKARDQG